MTMFLRLVFLITKRLFHFKKTNMMDPCYTSFIVGPLDLDTNFHVNNGRYLSIMDLGRFDIMIKAKVFWKLVLGGYYPVVVSESIRFKKSLALFNRFQIETRIDSWDEKDFYMRQTFLYKNQIMAIGFIKGRFLKRGERRTVPPQELFRFLNYEVEDKQKTKLAMAQVQLENELNAFLKK